jgi:hypothetical protein
MNYIVEINAFDVWKETNPISKSENSLWYALMQIDNRAGWPSQFTVAMSTLELKTRFKRSELFEARNGLQEKGRIKWNQRGGSLCAEYEIIPFYTDNTDAKPDANSNTNNTVSAIRTQEDTQPETQTHMQKGTINKLNKTKRNNTISPKCSVDKSTTDNSLIKEYEAIDKVKESIFNFIKDKKPIITDPYFDYWNLFAKENDLSPVKAINNTRIKKLKRRLSEENFHFLQIIRKASQSDFLLTSGKWFGFDWIIENESNYLKVLEGKYDNKDKDAAKKDLERQQYLEQRKRLEERTRRLYEEN